jgi:Head domain of trimeric autotransporter adhesin
MSVIVATSGATTPGSGSGGAALELYDEKPITPTPPAAQGDNSVAIGPGATTEATATNSIALGNQSLARHRGALVFANGRFGSTGDIQVGKYLLRTVTVNGADTEAYLNGTGGGERLVVPDDSTWTFTATITGHRTDTGDGHAGYKVEGVVYRQAGASSIAFQGTPVKTVLAESNTAWDINITADTTTGSLMVKVTGQAGKTIRWAVLVDTLEVTN